MRLPHQPVKTKRSHVVIAILLLGVLFGALAFVGLRAVMGYGGTFHGSFNGILPGISEARVVDTLGAADVRTAEFRLGQFRGFEKEYERAAESGSSYYLLWHKGIDAVYAVGFDEDGRVTMKAVGGT